MKSGIIYSHYYGISLPKGVFLCVRACVSVLGMVLNSLWFRMISQHYGAKETNAFLSCAPATWKHIPVFGTGLLLP